MTERRWEPNPPTRNVVVLDIQMLVKPMLPMASYVPPAKAGRLRSILGLVVGWAVLVCYLVAYAPVGLALAGLVGSLDRDHHVQFALGERGVALVLRHGADCAGHRHGIVARALTCFARPASAMDPDHVIQFGAFDSRSPKAELALPLLQAPEPPNGVPVETRVILLTRPVQRPGQPPPPPLGECGSLGCRRSTVLLI